MKFVCYIIEAIAVLFQLLHIEFVRRLAIAIWLALIFDVAELLEEILKRAGDGFFRQNLPC